MKLVIFDCDGTIVDSQHAILQAMHQAFVAAGLPPPAREGVLEVVGLSLSTAIARLLPEPDVGLVHWLGEAYKAAFAELRQSPAHSEPLFPGARETIAALANRGNLILGVATGKSRSETARGDGPPKISGLRARSRAPRGRDPRSDRPPCAARHP